MNYIELTATSNQTIENRCRIAISIQKQRYLSDVWLEI